MSVDNITEQFKNFSELQAFATSQYRTIIELSKRISSLEDEREHLKKLLDQSVPKEPSAEQKSLLIENATDEEIICRYELRKLKMKSESSEELTLEESKRVDIYTKLLQVLSGKKDAPAKPTEKLTPEQLMGLLKAVDGDAK